MYHFFARIFFLVGFLIGFFLTVFLIPNKSQNNVRISSVNNIETTINNTVYQKWFASTRLVRKKVSFDFLRYSNVNLRTEAKFLYNEVTILCVILVRHVKNAEAAKHTWAKGCNSIEYVNLDNKSRRKIVPIRRTKEQSSWILLCKALLNIKSYDWIVIVNDNSFVILENLRRLVAGLNYREGHYLGHAITFWTTTYNTGQAGYVLSWGSVEAIRRKFNHSAQYCTSEITYLNQEDMYLGKHLASLNITAVDTRDKKGLTRFYPHNWNQIFFPTSNTYKYSVYPVVCCSKLSITFQAIEAHKIYMYYYLLYTLQIFNEGNLGNQPAPTPVPEEQVWQKFLNGSFNVSAELYYKLWVEQIQDPTSFARELRKNSDYSD